jgi:hypothetical protein
VCLEGEKKTEVPFRNATSLIQEYWKKYKKEQAARKSTDSKPKKPGRKSSTNEGAKEKPSSTGRKRGRPKAKADNDSSVQEVSDDEEEAEEERAPKKPRKSNGASTTTGKKSASAKRATKTPEANVDDEEEDDEPIGDMKKFMTVASWEHLIKEVETVERGDGQLWVYFSLLVVSGFVHLLVLISFFFLFLFVTSRKKGGERVKEISKVCAEKFPQKV